MFVSLKASYRIYRFSLINTSLKAIVFALLAQVEVFATLQRLDLIPGLLSLPRPLVLIPLTSFSPIQLHNLILASDSNSLLTFISSATFSPLLLWLFIFRGKAAVDLRIREYLRLLIPRPENPDIHSIKAAFEEDIGDDQIPGFGSINDVQESTDYTPRTFTSEVKKDLWSLARNLQTGFGRCITGWSLLGVEKDNNTSSEEPPLESTYIQLTGTLAMTNVQFSSSNNTSLPDHNTETQSQGDSDNQSSSAETPPSDMVADPLITSILQGNIRNYQSSPRQNTSPVNEQLSRSSSPFPRSTSQISDPHTLRPTLEQTNPPKQADRKPTHYPLKILR